MYRGEYELVGAYLNFARANIRAGLAGDKYYEYAYGFGPTRARSQVHYCEDNI